MSLRPSSGSWSPPSGSFSPPDWALTARSRLALTYSAVLFGVSAVVLLALYAALSGSIEARPLDPVTVERFVKLGDGTVKYRSGETFEAADLESVQEAVNQGTLDTLRTYSLVALALMFLLSLVIGWWVAGRALRPLGVIAETTRDISATDLSRRIGATGPADELRDLADTIDGMLDRVEDAFEAQRDLVDDVSHELRNPIAVVQSTVDAILSRDDVTPADRERAAAVVGRATERMSRLIEDLLATARHRSGAFDEQESDLAAVVSAVVDEQTLRAAERDVELRPRLSPGPAVVVDAQAMGRVVDNIVVNAIRFSPPGGSVLVAVGSRRGWAWVAVRDEGPGIEPDDVDRVFDRFYTSGSGDRLDGAGLGLSIARQIVEAHGGRLVLRSELGVGSTFVIWLPDRAIAGAGERDLAPPGDDPLGRA